MKAKSLRLDDKVRAENELILTMAHTEDRKIIRWSLVGAFLLHVVFLVAHYPDFKDAVIPQKQQNVIVVKKYVPPPPKIERREVAVRKKQLTRKVPIPDPTPDEPEPIREPEPEVEDAPLPTDVEFLIGTPEPPAPSGPLLAGLGDVSNPVLIQETKLEPEYPELARVARLEGNVILQAVIRTDGSVAQIEVLRSNRPNMGFEESAIAAVQHWRYEPAQQNGRPVEVYFTVIVEFTLH